MKPQTIWKIWLGVAVLAIAYYFIYHKMKKTQMFTYLNSGLGFGDAYLSQMSFRELKDFYDYITIYTQHGKMPTAGSSLDSRLILLSKKFPQILQYT